MYNDLISREVLLYVFEPFADKQKGNPVIIGLEHVIAIIEEASAVDAEPVRHGRWLPTSDDNKKRCSRCDVIHLIAQYPHGQAIYCPNCGAKMDKSDTRE